MYDVVENEVWYREHKYTDGNDDDKILDNSVYDVVENEVDDQLDPNVSEYGPTPPRKYVSKYWTNIIPHLGNM